MGDLSKERSGGVFWWRKWNARDLGTFVLFAGIHGLCLLAPIYVNSAAITVAIALFFVTVFVTGLGLTLSYHRNLSHQSFKLPKWLEYSFAYCGVLSLQGSPIEWVSTHRYHHHGFWYSHVGWILNSHHRFEQFGGLKNVEDLTMQPFYRFLHNTSSLHSVVLGGILYVVGGPPFLVWGMGVRIVATLQSTLLVNSVGHTWGKQAWNTGDMSRNNWLLALMSHGEGWHNNHHAFEFSARHGLEWWQIDLTCTTRK